MALNNKRQSYLEIKAIDERNKELIRSDYNKTDSYSHNHEDAISNPENKSKVFGKGTNSGGHQHYTPDKTKSSVSYNYANLDTFNGGGAYDIYGKDEVGGRNRLLTYNIYSKEAPYSANSIDTSENINDGQYVIKG